MYNSLTRLAEPPKSNVHPVRRPHQRYHNRSQRYALSPLTPNEPSEIPFILSDMRKLTPTTVSELGMVTTGGKVVWGRWAQVTVSYPFRLER